MCRLLVRTKKPKANERATYVLAHLEIHKPHYEDMTFPQVMREILTQPMTPTELQMANLEESYGSTMRNTNLRNHLNHELLRGKFACSGGKWVCG